MQRAMLVISVILLIGSLYHDFVIRPKGIGALEAEREKFARQNDSLVIYKNELESQIDDLKKENRKFSRQNDRLKIQIATLDQIIQNLSELWAGKLQILTKEGEGGRIFYVVIGSFVEKERAEQHIQEAKRKGLLDVQVSLIWNKNICYAVLVGGYFNESTAKKRKKIIMKEFKPNYQDSYVLGLVRVKLTKQELLEKLKSLRIIKQ
jgi:hypothetical protein